MPDKKTASFAQLFETLRREKRLTLREFCKKAGADPANISRMERGAMSPPKSREILERYAAALGLKEGSDMWYKFFDLAAVAQGLVPADILGDEKLLRALPVFFRTLRGQKPSKAEMENIADKIRKGGRS
jgi:transcriptional regulator with XRE-family HTH domain